MITQCSSLLRRAVLKQNLNSKRFKVGYVVGSYLKDGKVILTDAASELNESCSGTLIKQLNCGGPIKVGQSRVLYGLSESLPVVSVAAIGTFGEVYDANEECDGKKEAVRCAIAAGCKSLESLGLDKIIIDPCGDSVPAAEGASLAQFKFQDLKSKKKKVALLQCLKENDADWVKGMILGEGQNIARRLMEMPANILTPTNFAQECVDILEKVGVEVCVRTSEWAKERNMNCFLAVSRGSCEPAVFLELSYRGRPNPADAPLALVGKGITFDSGGISIKPSAKMDKMRADMGGAACTVGALFAAAQLKLAVNIKGFIPLCENLPSGSAVKPGDVVVASNGKSVQIDNTDAEGRLILADALHYACQHKPRVLLDMATLTGAMAVALGSSATGVFTKSGEHWRLLRSAGSVTGDRVWRMPLWNVFARQVKDYGMADVHNLGKHARLGGSSLAASFLQQFVSCDDWMHLDIAGVMENADEVPYLGPGMSGRPTRTIVEYASSLAAAS